MNSYIMFVFGVFVGIGLLSARTKIANRRERHDRTNRRLYLPSSIEFSNRVSGKDRLTIQVTPYDAEPAETTFDIEHFEKGIAPLKKACQW